MLNHRNIFFLCVYDLECIYNIYPGGGKKKQTKPTNQPTTTNTQKNPTKNTKQQNTLKGQKCQLFNFG